MDLNMTTLLAAAAVLATLWLAYVMLRQPKAGRSTPAPGAPSEAASDNTPEAYRELVRRIAPKHRATADALLGAEVEILGEQVTCECLSLNDGFYWAQVLAAARAGNALAQLRMADFPAAISPVGKEELFQLLQPQEVYALADRFLAHERPGVLRGIDPEATTTKIRTKTKTSSTGGSTT